MSRVERFEELIAWQKARVLTAAVYEITRQGGFARDFGLSGQIQRAAVSIMSNIAEGFERNSPAEFHQFLSTAKASCAELRSQLYVALDAGYLSQDKFTQLHQQAEEVGKIIGGLRAAEERQRNEQRGREHHTQGTCYSLNSPNSVLNTQSIHYTSTRTTPYSVLVVPTQHSARSTQH